MSMHVRNFCSKKDAQALSEDQMTTRKSYTLTWTDSKPSMTQHAHVEDCIDEGGGAHYYADVSHLPYMDLEAVADIAVEDFAAKANYEGIVQCRLWLYNADDVIVARRTFAAGQK